MNPSGSVARITKTTERMPNLSDERRHIEDVLRNAAEPLTPSVITSRSGVVRARVVVVLQRLRLDGLAVNIGTPAKPRWRWRANASTWKAPVTAADRISNCSTSATYDGAELRPFDGRPGAMDFKKWPSKGLK